VDFWIAWTKISFCSVALSAKFVHILEKNEEQQHNSIISKEINRGIEY
jgi:hypothetical protein